MDTQMLFLGQSMDRGLLIFFQQSTSVIVCHRANNFFITPLKSTFKKLFLGNYLVEQLHKMSAVKLISKGLKVVECEHGMGGKKPLIYSIPE